MQIDKWYLDLQNQNDFGFYEIGIVRFLGMRFNFVEVTHMTRDETQHYYLDGWGGKQRDQQIKTSHANIQFDQHHLDLKIKKGHKSIIGNWTLKPTYKDQLDHPLFENEDGSFDWNIFTPRSKVILHRNNDPKLTTSGSGYIDHIKLTIPLWKVPFNLIRWGRLFDEQDNWLILFHISSSDHDKILIGDKDGWHSGTEVNLTSPTPDLIQTYEWKTKSFSLTVDAVDSYRDEKILDDERLGWLSRKIRNTWSRQGFEEKYSIVCEHNNTVFKGVLKEMRWTDS